MSTEVKRRAFRDADGQPMHIIEFGHGDREGQPVSNFRVTAGNRTIREFATEDEAENLVTGMGGIETGDVDVMAIAAEIGGTAAHQAAHAPDIARPADRIRDQREAEATVDEADAKAKEALAAGKKAPRESAATRKAREAVADTKAQVDAQAGVPDSQATGVMEMPTGLQPTADKPIVERVEGAANGEANK